MPHLIIANHYEASGSIHILTLYTLDRYLRVIFILAWEEFPVNVSVLSNKHALTGPAVSDLDNIFNCYLFGDWSYMLTWL